MGCSSWRSQLREADDLLEILQKVWLNWFMQFEWDPRKNAENEVKHGISFFEAQMAFADPKRVIRIDRKHSTKKEKRYFCFGKVYDDVLTVRFCIRRNGIRIFGAGFWREGRHFYEEKDAIQ